MEHLGEDEWNTQREEEQHLFHQREVPPPEEDLSHWKRSKFSSGFLISPHFFRVQDWFCSLLQSINDPAKARDARKYSLLILSVYVPLPVIIALKQLFYEGELYSGRPAEVVGLFYPLQKDTDSNVVLLHPVNIILCLRSSTFHNR